MTTTKLQKKIKATKKPKVWQNENTSRLLQDKGADTCNPVLGREGQRTQVKTSLMDIVQGHYSTPETLLINQNCLCALDYFER